MPNPTPQPDIDELREKIQYIMGQVANWGQTFTDDGEDPSTRVCAGGTKALYPAVDEIITLLTTHTEKAVSAAREDNFIAKLQTYSITDQQLILGGLIYKYFMLATNATKVTMTLSNFSHKDKVLGDLVIKAELQATTPNGGEDE